VGVADIRIPQFGDFRNIMLHSVLVSNPVFFYFESWFSKVKSGFSQRRVSGFFSGSGFFSSPDFLRVRIRVRVSNYAASVAQSSEQAPVTSENVGSILATGPFKDFQRLFLPIFKDFSKTFESNQLSKN
jgi:hypothetical protein